MKYIWLGKVQLKMILTAYLFALGLIFRVRRILANVESVSPKDLWSSYFQKVPLSYELFQRRLSCGFSCGFTIEISQWSDKVKLNWWSQNGRKLVLAWFQDRGKCSFLEQLLFVWCSQSQNLRFLAFRCLRLYTIIKDITSTFHY